MIDLHLHILPGVDDGAADLTISAAMLQECKRQGYRQLVATPHLVERLTEEYYARVQHAYGELQPIASHLGIQLLTGFEVVLTPDLPKRLHWGEPITLGGSVALLVELPITVWPTYTEVILFELQTAGYRPVLAHPERYETLRRDPARAERLAEQGVVLQVTTSTLAGLFGRSVQRLAERWIQAGAVHVVSSDAHSRGRRMTEVPHALQRLERLVGPEEVHRLTVTAPAALLSDAPIPLAASYTGRGSGGFLSRLWR